jgi:hypothetical protein
MMFDLSLTREEVETLYYSLAHAEMMWRKRSHNPEIDAHGSYEEPEEFERTCRMEMARYRVMQKQLEAMLPVSFWDDEEEE